MFLFIFLPWDAGAFWPRLGQTQFGLNHWDLTCRWICSKTAAICYPTSQYLINLYKSYNGPWHYRIQHMGELQLCNYMSLSENGVPGSPQFSCFIILFPSTFVIHIHKWAKHGVYYTILCILVYSILRHGQNCVMQVLSYLESSSVSDGWLLQWLFRRFPCLHDKSKKIRWDLWCDPKVGWKSKKIQIWKKAKPAQQGTHQHIFLSALILLKFKEMRRDKESRWWMDGDSS